jgi:hypothetical protein
LRRTTCARCEGGAPHSHGARWGDGGGERRDEHSSRFALRKWGGGATICTVSPHTRIHPPPANGNIGGGVKGCPLGICIVGLYAPEGTITTTPATVVAQVCGAAAVHSCIVGVGDFAVKRAGGGGGLLYGVCF